MYKSEKKVKGQTIVIRENLTQNRYKIYQAVIAKFDKKAVRTTDGRIFAKVNGNIIIIIISSIKVLDEY